MNAKEIYDSIKVKYPDDLEKSICQLHKPCAETPKCSSSNKKVIDFDKVERLQHHGVPPKPSVDAVTYNGKNTVFCFVEIKGWEQFHAYQLATTADKDKEDKIKKQVSKYDLKGKLDNSLALCQEITGDANCFKTGTEAVYMIVADIDVKKNPLESILYDLTILAETSSPWKDLCNKYLYQALQKVPDIRKFYIQCKDFDRQIAEL